MAAYARARAVARYARASAERDSAQKALDDASTQESALEASRASLQGEGSDAGPAQSVVEEIRKAGGEAMASTLSIAEPGNAETIVTDALKAFDRVDILVNNAGILRDVIFHKMSFADW